MEDRRYPEVQLKFQISWARYMKSRVGCVSDIEDESRALSITLFTEDSRKLWDAVSLLSQFCDEKDSNQRAVAGVRAQNRPRAERFSDSPSPTGIPARELVDRPEVLRELTTSHNNLVPDPHSLRKLPRAGTTYEKL